MADQKKTGHNLQKNKILSFISIYFWLSFHGVLVSLGDYLGCKNIVEKLPWESQGNFASQVTEVIRGFLSWYALETPRELTKNTDY